MIKTRESWFVQPGHPVYVCIVNGKRDK